jgi:hypothetical protein
MRRGFRAVVLSLLLFTVACADESLPTATSALGGATGASEANNTQPTLSGIDLLNQGGGFVSLTARASDPQNRLLNFNWQVNGGTLSSSTGRAVLWRVPAEAGTYTAVVEVSNGAGGTVSGSQTFTVDPQGQVANQGQLNTGPTNLAVRQSSGALGPTFAIPSPLRVAPDGRNVVQSNPFAAPGSPSPVLPPIFQPAATPVPAPAPVIVPLQPIAEPIVTPPPVVLPPSPLPSPSPPAAEPGVPVRPAEAWRPYREAGRELVPAGVNLTCLHFQSARRGWFAGGNRVLLYNRTDDTEPALVARDAGLPSQFGIQQIHFVDDNTGFVAGFPNWVYRTTDAGLTWTNVSPPGPLSSNSLTAMVVVNANVVTVSNQLGEVWRSENGGADWQVMPTFPVDRPDDNPRLIRVGAGLRSDASLAFFGGESLYRLDVDAPNPADRWKKILSLIPLRAAPVVDAEGIRDWGDGQATQVRAASTTEIWVSTAGGTLYRLRNANSDAIQVSRFLAGKYVNREANRSGVRYLPAPGTGVNAMSVVDPNNIFLGHVGFYDSNDAGESWREFPGVKPVVRAMEVNFSTEPTEAGRFRGWAIEGGNGVYQYKVGSLLP